MFFIFVGSSLDELLRSLPLLLGIGLSVFVFACEFFLNLWPFPVLKKTSFSDKVSALCLLEGATLAKEPPVLKRNSFPKELPFAIRSLSCIFPSHKSAALQNSASWIKRAALLTGGFFAKWSPLPKGRSPVVKAAPHYSTRIVLPNLVWMKLLHLTKPYSLTNHCLIVEGTPFY